MLTQDRVLSEKNVPHGPEFAYRVAEGVRIYRGAILALCTDGTLIPAGPVQATHSPIIGIAGIAACGSEGDPETILAGKGCLALPFDTAPDFSAIGKDVYVRDDETVSLSNGAAPSEDSQNPNPALWPKIGTLAGIEGGTAYVLIS